MSGMILGSGYYKKQIMMRGDQEWQWEKKVRTLVIHPCGNVQRMIIRVLREVGGSPWNGVLQHADD